MPSDSRLAALPAVRKLAEEQAQGLCGAIRNQRGMRSDHTEGALYEAQLCLLSDLSRPESWDAMVRLVADRTYATRGGKGGYIFGVGPCGWGILYDMENHWCVFDEIPGLYGVDGPTDPVEALTVFALHVLGADHG